MTTALSSPAPSSSTSSGPRRAPGLPAIHRLAWHGAVGESVLRIAPTTEADPVAVLAQLLAMVGAMAGPGLRVRIGGVPHPARIWPLIVGKTGSGRKGTSLAEARHLARSWSPYCDAYQRGRVVAGLSSGEGLLAALGAGHKNDEPDGEVTAPDGRLTVTETEFARVLSAAKREGNTLGPVLRQMWETGDAQVLTKAAPLRVDGAHLGLIAHITPRELRLRLGDADIAGGTVNRLLIIAAERPHLLPHEPPHPDTSDLGGWLGTTIDKAHVSANELHRDREADELWRDEVYPTLEAPQPDTVMAEVLTRGPAYTMRLALAYALADRSFTTISKHHLLAGLALWQYSAASARMVFSDAETRSDERKIATELQRYPGGVTRADIYRLFSGNRRAEQLDALLGQLERRGQVIVTTEKTTGGRPAQRYEWTGRAGDPITTILDSYS